MMSRVLQSIPRGLRLTAQSNATHPPWAGNGSQQRRRQEESLYSGLGAAPLSSDATVLEERSSHQPLHKSKNCLSLVKQTLWSWEDGWKGFIGKKQGDSFRGKGNSYTSNDALEWGTALMFSLHLCRVLTAASLPDDSSSGKKLLFASVADKLFGLWRKPVGGFNLLPKQHDSLPKQEEKKTKPKSAEIKQKTENPEDFLSPSLASAVANLQAVANQSIGQAYNSIGVKRAQEGCLEDAASHFTEGSKVGFGRATFNLGVCYEEGRGVAQDLEKAADLYKKATAQGHPLATYNLGVLHMKGVGGVQQDTGLALKLLGSAAQAGVTQANRYMGMHYLENLEHRDETKATQYLQKAVDNEDMEARYRLGLCYEHGWGVSMNTAKAASLYHKAALKGHSEALYSLARFHELGLGGLPCNRESALQFYKQASEAGHQQASEHLLQLQSNPTSDTNKFSEAGLRDGAITSHAKERHLSQEAENKVLHLSFSAPSLTHDSDKDLRSSTTKQFGYKNEKSSISHLGLFLPYYLSLPSRPAVMGSVLGQGSKVNFQVGDDDSTKNEIMCGHVEKRVQASTPCLTVS